MIKKVELFSAYTQEEMQEKIENFISDNYRGEKKLVNVSITSMYSVFIAAVTYEEDENAVIRAYWKEQFPGRHICSYCGVKASYVSDEYDYMEDLSDYCHVCGAKMDKKRDE